MTAREMSLVEGYVSASDFLLTSKIQDIPVWLIREIIRSGLMVSSPQVLRSAAGSSGGPQGRQVGLRVVRWASGSSGGPQGRQVGLRVISRWALGSLGQLQGRQVAGLQGCSVQRFIWSAARCQDISRDRLLGS
jgi:hypothetical protein